MRKTWLFWSACVPFILYSCAGSRQASSGRKTRGDTLTVMTYNIRHGAAIHQRDNAVDLEAVAAVINAAKPDLVALQEVDSMTRRAPLDEARELGRLTGMHYFFSRTIAFQGGAYGDAILSRSPILATARTLLPMPVKGEDRAVGMITAEPLRGMKIVFATTHLALKKKDRLAQADTLEQIAGESRYPFILAGDFNAVPSSAVMGRLLKSAFTSGCGTGCPLTFPSDKPRRTIDYVLWSRKAPGELAGAGSATVRTTASDHLPLLQYLVKQ